MTDEALWQAAWAERPRLLAIARRRCRSRADAEEIVSEATLRAVTLPGVEPERLAALLTALTMRLCVDSLRERTVSERNAHRLFARPTDATDDVLDRAEAQWLSAEVARLADSERAALTARMLGLSLEETAEVLGLTYRAAESALGRARRKMRTLWTRTLGVLLPWRRRRRGAPLVSVVAASALLLLPPAHHGGPDARRPTPGATTVARSSGIVSPRRVASPATGAVTDRLSPHADPSRVPQTQGMRLVTRRVAVGPVVQDPVVITVVVSSPLARVGRCAKNGVEVRTGDPQVGIVCREG